MLDTNNVKNQITGRKVKMPVGVHAGVQLDHVEEKTTNTGRKLIEVYFVNSSGEVLDKTVWIPNPETVKVWEGESREQAIAREEDFFTREVLTITSAICEDERVTGKTPEEFAKNFVKKLESANKKAAVVVQYDKNFQYPEFPKYQWIKPYTEGVMPVFNLEPLRMKKEEDTDNFAFPTTDNDHQPGPAVDDLPF